MRIGEKDPPTLLSTKDAQFVSSSTSSSESARLQFLRRFFHDLATPLSAVSLHLEGADRRLRRGADAFESLDIARSELSRAFELFERGREILLFPGEAGTSFPFDEWVADVVRAFRAEVSVTGATGGRIFADRRSLTEAFESLLANALEFSQRGEVSVARERRDSRLAVVVENTGRLPLEDPERLFSPGVKSSGKNWGMGLPRARLRAAEAGGTLTLEQKRDRVTATLEIPEETNA
jgi:signal transduction histidine kinase